MYIAMNRFKVETGSELAFEAIWRNRQSSLDKTPGFVAFHMLRGKENPLEGFTLYSSHTSWASEQDFLAWTRSDSFRASHRNAGDHKPMYKGHPVFEGFEVIADLSVFA
jgi:heme-degrading monooxygenase HmoA